MSARTLMSLASVGVSAILLAGCVQPLDQDAGVTRSAGYEVAAGISCGHVLSERWASTPGCESYMADASAEMTKAQLLDLNQRFLEEVQVIVNFDFDQDVLRPDARATLDAQAKWIKHYAGLRFSVFGHTDLTGSLDYNFDLAKRRADAVVGYLLARGIPTEQLEAVVSFGKTQPLIQSRVAEERNRRTVTEVTGYLRVAAFTKTSISCAALDPRYGPTYPQCLTKRDPVPQPTRAAPPVAQSIAAGYPKSQTAQSGNMSGSASIITNEDGSTTRGAQGTTGPVSDPNTQTMAESNQQADGSVGNLSASVTMASGETLGASSTVNADGSTTDQGGTQSVTH
jgi:outer membrane protein OmpA-like peptidoglycan-associated protein